MKSELLSFIRSVANATTTTLGASATYTGTGELNGFPDVMVTCEADVTGTLFLEFSDTGVFGGEESTFPVAGVSISANIYEFHTAVKGPRYFRVRYVNDETAQSSFRINTYYGTFRQGNLPVNANIASDADAIVVRSVSADLDLAFGRFSGMSEDSKFGRVTGIDPNDNAVDIWAFADDTANPRSDTKTFPNATVPIYVFSSSASDTDQLTVNYINSNGYGASSAVYLNGSSALFVTSGQDVNRMYASGSTAFLGLIYAVTQGTVVSSAPSAPGAVIAFIPQGYQQTEQSQITVPIDEHYRIKHINLFMSRTSGAAGSATITLRIKGSNGVSTIKREFFVTDAYGISKPSYGLTVSGGSQIVFRLDSVSDLDTQVSAVWAFDSIKV